MRTAVLAGDDGEARGLGQEHRPEGADEAEGGEDAGGEPALAATLTPGAKLQLGVELGLDLGDAQGLLGAHGSLDLGVALAQRVGLVGLVGGDPGPGGVGGLQAQLGGGALAGLVLGLGAGLDLEAGAGLGGLTLAALQLEAVQFAQGDQYGVFLRT